MHHLSPPPNQVFHNNKLAIVEYSLVQFPKTIASNDII
jgi:hypothetical protein